MPSEQVCSETAIVGMTLGSPALGERLPMTPREAAEFMHARMVGRSWDYADTIVHTLRRESPEYVHRANGKLTIDASVLRQFRSLTPTELVWLDDGLTWREPKGGEVIKNLKDDAPPKAPTTR